ncbi:type IV pilin protein [Cystobacter ferrugineus]|uniref:Uncharacterized protein n=1 Tax=Cystobacter ferrugineus TaxID=83449 RepID=A0A1L9AXS2_9BACT|nr:prepilin-type N-terminal cleavage/methylation domain-containing protein [Cystobacter ferrugineus]OJH34807.1 hypothetical protein BON30_42410 [Cystobacter ferrugineus]
MHRPPLRKHQGFTLIEFMLVVAMLSLLAVIAIPNFLKRQTLSKQAEAKANLKAWFSAQRAYHEEYGSYSEQVHTVGFLPERGNRYAYYFSFFKTCITRQASGVIDPPNANCVTVDGAEFPGDLMPTPVTPLAISYVGAGADPGMPGLNRCTGTNCNISGLAAGNIDDESPGTDTWWISTKDTSRLAMLCGNNETASVAGEPYLSYNDEVCDD